MAVVKKKKRKKVKVTFTYLFSLSYTIFPREDAWKTEWWNKKIIIIPLILPFPGAKFSFLFSLNTSQMVNRPSLQAMQIVGNGWSQISVTLKPTESIYRCILLHVWCLSNLKKKQNKTVHTGQPLRKLFFFWSDSGRMESASLLTPSFSIHVSRGPRKAGRAATKPMWHT